MIAEMIECCVYQEPLSIYRKCFNGVTILSLIGLAVMEFCGKNVQYSKFGNYNNNSKKSMVSSRSGWIILYIPTIIGCISSFWLLPHGGIRFLIFKSAITIHFFKRLLEVLFVHKFSGFITLQNAILISITCFTSFATIFYLDHQTHRLPGPSVDLKYLGVALTLIGSSGNLYHHYLLSKLRQNTNDKSYKIPRGGLFNLVICPHYLFEIITFVGFSFISQSIHSYLCAIGIAVNLLGRSYTTRKWYISKFEDFPKSVKALIPYVV